MRYSIASTKDYNELKILGIILLQFLKNIQNDDN
jgi:hypothetical protein